MKLQTGAKRWTTGKNINTRRILQKNRGERFYKILLLKKEHPVRYSTINPNTGAEWDFGTKRQGGPKVRWEREAIKEAWGQFKTCQNQNKRPCPNLDYITNTTEAKKRTIDYQKK